MYIYNYDKYKNYFEVIKINSNIEKYEKLITDYARLNYRKMFREPDGYLKYKYIVPGSTYSDCLWDWDSWLTDIALRNIGTTDELEPYEKGCILNFLEHIDDMGRLPISIRPASKTLFGDSCDTNTHKPCLAIHALYICRQINSFEWLKPHYEKMERFVKFYFDNCRHESGLFFWLDDRGIGVDNDPCTFYRPPKSSASIYLNCLMYKELSAMAEIANELDFADKHTFYSREAQILKNAICEHLWDERNGFYYSADLNLLPIDPNQQLHAGYPRHWSTLIQRIDVWSGFMAMWAEIATPDQAERMVSENFRNERTFNAPYGIRSLSKLEKMYLIVKSGNPSCWLGPIWGISNYMTFDGLVKYGFISDARELAEKTITLFGQDIEKNGELHEYYDPDTGVGVNNPGFQNWNLLALNMINWLNNN